MGNADKGLVSVIIPCYNAEKWIEKTIQSCLEQGELLREIIVVDDHSTDDSRSIVKHIQEEHPDMIRLFENPEKGANQARNFGFEQSGGEYIQWLDADDLLLPEKFETQVRALQNSGADIVYSDWRMDFYENGNKVRSEERKCREYDDYLLELLKDNWTAQHNYLMKRQIAKELHDISAWNPKTRVSQDREYFTMAGILGARFTYVNGKYSIYNKQSSNSISSLDFRNRLELNQSLELRLRNEISISDHIPQARKMDYFNILDTHMMKACFYHPGIKTRGMVNPFKLKWGLIHWKMRIYMPFLVLRKNLEHIL